MIYYFENKENWKRAKEELLSWVGTPYKHMGNVKKRGVDCNMFIGKVLVNLGIVEKVKGKIPRIKILARGEIKKKLIVKGIEVSDTAAEKIEKAGGKVIE